MAGSSQKKLAKSNTKILKEIHILSLLINLFTLFTIYVFQRPLNKKPFFIFAVPLIICQYVIEKTGRPVFENGQIVNAGQDLSMSGLTEYLFDIIYITNFCDLVMIIFGSNKIWYIYLSIPLFGVYKLIGLLQWGKQLMAPKKPVREEPLEPAKSKRQLKKESRGQTVRYR